ncbi:hypothetical protein [Aquabacter cavernae]|uniref:hypothetical protein n=1 Tax=Aquabacter cavernae TaxID=2496029 RepID=UPI000F8CEEC9|nr:hypothetical protein [Aquabacter cavernae]
MRDLHSNIGVIEAIPPAVYDADNSPAAIDLLGFDAAEIVIHVGIGGITFTGTNKIEFVLSHSDDESAYAPVTVSDLLGVASVTNGIVLAFKTAHAAATLHRLGYIGGRRYLKLLADFGGTHGTGTPLSATVIKGHAASRPVAA